MKHSSPREHVLDILFPLALLIAFVASAVMVLLLAANVYGDIADHASRGYTARTVTAYLTEKIHQNDQSGGVHMGRIQDADALVLEHGEDYSTYIYMYDGTLRELLIKKGAEIGPESGQKILPLQKLEIRQVTEQLFYFMCRDEENGEASAYVSVKSVGE